MRGTNFCTNALLGAIYAELGLMAVTAETTPGGEKASEVTAFRVRGQALPHPAIVRHPSLTPRDDEAPIQATAGRTFWFERNRFDGSYRALIRASLG